MSLFSYKSATSSNTGSNFLIAKPTPASSTKENETNGASLFRLNQYDYVPKRFGLRFDPPSIIVEYLVPSSGKLYHHKMKILGLKETSNNKEVIETLRNKHPGYFTSNKLSDTQLSNLIDRLKKRLPLKKQEKNEGLVLPGTGTSKSGLVLKPAVTNVAKPSDKPAPALTSSLSSTATSKFGVSTKNTNENASNNNEKDGNGFWDVDDEEEEIDYQTANLNKLAPEEVKKHKDKMDVLFKQNQKKPGDPGFIYDKQEEFDPKEDNEWDEEL